MFSTVTGWVISSPVEASLWPSSTSGTEAIVTSPPSCHSGDRRATPRPKVKHFLFLVLCCRWMQMLITAILKMDLSFESFFKQKRQTFAALFFIYDIN